ncbi:MAG TPA: OmpA family protein [Terriglobales bacterium]|nr:OmpA family protein [Terriglobales bacterium]
MSLCYENFRRCASVALVLAVVLIALPSLLNAQTAPKAPTATSDDFPKVELFVGYQWLNPGGNIPDQTPPPAGPLPFKLPSISQGFGTNLTYNFTKNLGLEGNYGGDWNRNASISTVTAGPKLTWRGDDVNVFVHTLVGFQRLSSRGIDSTNGVAAVLGGGMDLKLWKPVTLRLFEADYQLQRVNFSGNVPADDSSLRRQTYNGVRLTTGLVFNFGGAPEVPVAAACSIDHTEVLVGEPLHVTVAGSNFNPKHTVTYAWASTGGKIEGKDTAASIDTNGAAPGAYVATATITDPKAKKNNTASCSSNFTVKPLNPPQISCSANPSTVDIGTSSTISCTCTSPDNATVTVANWTSSSGSVSGSGNSATLATTGASAGPVTVNSTCTDSRGLTASTSTTVSVNNPPPPVPVVDKVLEARLALHSVYFATAKPTEKDPTGGLVTSQEQTLTTLAADFKVYLTQVPNAHLTLEGHADERGSVPYNQALSERRTTRVKSFLVAQGIPEADIDTKDFGKQHNLTADEVKSAVEENPDITKEEKTRFLRNITVIKWASNRRVDVTLNNGKGETETSVRHYPFNAADSLTLIGGREADRKAAAAKKPAPKKKAAPKKPAKQ